MSNAVSLQKMLLKLSEFWADYGCIIWQPYNVQVGAGTMNPATFMRVLGPEPWNVAYVEPSVRPDDGRFGENPNRMQYYYQYQVILKPDPGNPQEVYLQSLEALGIDRREHDIRFVEDNWKQPAIGAWGLGWEVWLDGMEITQFTYFQQTGGINLNPVPVEITYGVERILMALQGVRSVWDIEWSPGVKYADVLRQSEIDHCHYYFNAADVESLRQTHSTYEQEAIRALEYDPPLVLPAHDYVLKCSHLFNILDTRGAVGVVERADYFRRMQRLAARVARAYVEQRKDLGFPLVPETWGLDVETGNVSGPSPEPSFDTSAAAPTKPAPFVLELGTEELPASDLDSAIEQLAGVAPEMLADARLDYDSLHVTGTPRRLVLMVEGLAPNQKSEDRVLRGPPARVAFDANGKPTKAAEGFARSNGISVDDLERAEVEGGEYVIAKVRDEGQPTVEVLAALLPEMLSRLHFEQNMRWNWSGVSFSRPIRWIVALLGGAVVPFTYADIASGRISRGTRLMRSPEVTIKDAAAYTELMAGQDIVVDRDKRRAVIAEQIEKLAASIGGAIPDDPGLLDEVTNLVEQPTALLGEFEEEYLELPTPVLITVMKKHQRYFPVLDRKGRLLPNFITVRNGDDQHIETVTAGNASVIRARFSDARFFIDDDLKMPLAEYLPALKTLTFQEELGSYYQKTARIEGLAARLAGPLGITGDAVDVVLRAARLAKADLATRMVVEMTSLQGVIGAEYARRSGEPDAVAEAIEQHYRPTGAGRALPEAPAAIAIALADRADSIAGLFAVGLAPTGSADPYGLRRAAQSLVQIILGHELTLDLREVMRWAAEGQPEAIREAALQAQHDVMAFISGRLYGVLREDFEHDVTEAVLGELAHDPAQASVHAAQLTGWVAKSGWAELLDAYARCVRITRQETQSYWVNPEHFEAEIEKTLFEAYQEAASAIRGGTDVDGLLTAFKPLITPITVFFDRPENGGVLVMADDENVRHNRLALLQGIVHLADGVADFSKLEGF